MARTCCLAGIDQALVPLFSAAFKLAGEPSQPTLARLNVAELKRRAPDVLVCDLDDVDADRLELLRQIRFVLPDCLIAVYTGDMKRTWGSACHFAGANCLLSKDSSAKELASGLRDALSTGCYTDPRFAA